MCIILDLQVQNNLARPFPFIREVEVLDRGDVGAGQVAGGQANMQQRLGGLVSAIGKTVRKKAVTAYERIGTTSAALTPRQRDRCRGTRGSLSP